MKYVTYMLWMIAMIHDINVGYGNDAVNEVVVEENDILNILSGTRVKRMAVHPIYLTDTYDANSRVAGLQSKNNQISGIGLVNPIREYKAESELERLISFMDMSGVLVRPHLHGYNFNLQVVSDFIELVYKYGVPIFVYCEESFTPSQIKAQAIQYEIIDFIVLNGIQKYGYGEISSLLRGCDNVFISSSLLHNPNSLRKIIDEFGPERVLFGSGYPYYEIGDELSKVERAIRFDFEKERIYSENFTELVPERKIV